MAEQGKKAENHVRRMERRHFAGATTKVAVRAKARQIEEIGASTGHGYVKKGDAQRRNERIRFL